MKLVGAERKRRDAQFMKAHRHLADRLGRVAMKRRPAIRNPQSAIRNRLNDPRLVVGELHRK